MNTPYVQNPNYLPAYPTNTPYPPPAIYPPSPYPQTTPYTNVPTTVSDYAVQGYQKAVNTIQPVMENAIETVQEASSSAYKGIQKSLSKVLPNTPILNSVGNFKLSSELPSYSSSSVSKNIQTKFSEFFSFNSIITKIAFLLLIIILFLLLMKLAINVLVYTYQENSSPSLIEGVSSGNTAVTITRDPSKTQYVTIPRSNNQFYGAEFTWSVWLNVNGLDNIPNQYAHVFNVGGNNVSSDGTMNLSNAPGLYLTKYHSDAGGYSLGMHVVMDSEPFKDFAANGISHYLHNKSLDITELPLNNWFHVIIRMENDVLDVYINGTIAGRTNFESVPKQNYYDIQICQNQGFDGYLSNLRYYSRALNVFDINVLVLAGPNLSSAKIIGATNQPATLAPDGKMSSYDYLSQWWYFQESNNYTDQKEK